MAEVLPAPITEDVEDVPNIVVVKFADSQIPVFKEKRNKDYIEYGKDNAYPEYLTYLFDKSGKHGAIVSGKAFYVFGKGYANGDMIVNRLGESLNDVSKKAVLDIETYGGFKFEIIWNRIGKIAEIYHVDYNTIRKGKSGGFWWKEQWTIKGIDGRIVDNNKEEAVYIPAFDPTKPYGSQIFQYNEYRPGQKYYPLPSYIPCNNYIETDIEISKFYLSSIRNGMMPSKMLQFYMGDPGEDKKKALERSFARKFAGAENAGKFILVFNAGGKDKTIDVEDLSGTELDKMFVELNKTCQQEIFSGHKVTSPMLFGIKTEGQLGGNTELQTSYAIFQNTYAKPKADAFDKEINYLLKYSVYPGEYELLQTDPVGYTIPDELIKQAFTPDEVREKMGLPILEKPADTPSAKTLSSLSSVSPLVATKILDNLTQNEIRGLASLPPIPGGDIVPATADTTAEPKPIAAPGEASAEPVNDAIRNLNAKQHQQLLRIIRQYGKGQLTAIAAKTLLKTGLGLSDDDINNLLGIQPAPVPVSAEAFSDVDQDSLDEFIADMFDEYGDCKDDFEILRTKKALFSSEDEMEEDELIYKTAFATYDISATENKILELIKKDKRITPEVIAATIGQTKTFVESKIDGLMKKGYLESSIENIGHDQIVERSVPAGIDLTAPPPTSKIPATQIYVKYSYEVKPNIGPSVIPTTRPFCRKMVQLNRLYTRADIEKISARLGYSVFDRKGGWWGKSPECRHRWVSHIVVKKGGES